jgi:hypothetical protein
VPNLTAKHAAVTEYFSVFPELFQEICDVGFNLADKEIPFRYLSNYSTSYTLGYYFFLPWRNSTPPPSGPGPLHDRGFTITLRYITLRRTPLDE